MSDTADRQQTASPRRRQQARQQGFVPRSREFVFALVFASVALTLLVFGPSLWRLMEQRLRSDLLSPSEPLRDPLGHLQQLIVQVLWWVSPWLLAMSTAATLGHWLQHGPLWLPDQVRIDPERVNPARGLQRLLQPAGFAALLLGTVKMLLLLLLAGWLLQANWSALLALSLGDSQQMARQAALLLMRCGAWLGVALLIWGAVDFAWQLYRYERGLRMSPDEMREEVHSVQNDVSDSRRRR